MNNEVIKGVISKFFKVGFYNQQYYEIVVTNERLLFVWMGESYKPWMLRIDPGMYKREELEKLQIHELVNYNDKNFSLYFNDINKLKLKKPTYFKNGFIIINTTQEVYKLFTKERKADFNNYHEILKDVLKEKVTLH
jgi:hypothetical protein